jgi:hypothetical protein
MAILKLRKEVAEDSSSMNAVRRFFNSVQQLREEESEVIFSVQKVKKSTQNEQVPGMSVPIDEEIAVPSDDTQISVLIQDGEILEWDIIEEE